MSLLNPNCVAHTSYGPFVYVLEVLLYIVSPVRREFTDSAPKLLLIGYSVSQNGMNTYEWLRNSLLI